LIDATALDAKKNGAVKAPFSCRRFEPASVDATCRRRHIRDRETAHARCEFLIAGEQVDRIGQHESRFAEQLVRFVVVLVLTIGDRALVSLQAVVQR
jgi:hypothetical protein